MSRTLWQIRLGRSATAARPTKTPLPADPANACFWEKWLAVAASQYDGTCAVPILASPTYDCHPNVFQGKSLILVTGQTNQVLFTHVPIDPPGTLCPATIGADDATTVPALCHRIIRITNIRGDASQTGVATGSNGTSSINAQIIATPPGGLPVGDPSRVVARVQAGLVTPILTNNGIPGGKFDFIQCKVLEDYSQNQGLAFTFREGFSNSFKPRSFAAGSQQRNRWPVQLHRRLRAEYCRRLSLTNQNVPGTSYDTESGFMNNNAAAGGDNPNNPLAGGVGAGNNLSTRSTLPDPAWHGSVPALLPPELPPRAPGSS